MQSFMHSLTVWVRRLTARNPLVRATDLLEASALFLIGAVAILTIPIAGAIGTATYDHLTHTYAAERMSRHQIDATVASDSREMPEPYENPFITPITWTYNGDTHTDEIRTGQLRAGDTVTIVVDGTGKRRAPVPTDADAAAQAVMAALLMWSTVAGAAVGAGLLLRMRLNHLRFSAWDRELQDLADNGGRANNSTP